jgi:hypothetical protein
VADWRVQHSDLATVITDPWRWHNKRINIEHVPPCLLVTRLMDYPVMATAQRHRELVAHFQPDGVSVSEPWIAISNHNTHSVLLYENTGSLNEYSEPNGILRYAHYPHGLQFTSDGRFILVADAGAPYVHIYMKDGSGWRGVRSPFKSLRVLNDEDFFRGRTTVHQGGPKGIDIDNSMSTFVTTCEVLPLAFFDLAGVLEWIFLMQRNGSHSSPGFGETLNESYETHCQGQRALEIKYELERQDQSNQAVALLMNSRSWRITAPLRWVSDAGRRVLGRSV